jgi:hypothetical protein
MGKSEKIIRKKRRRPFGLKCHLEMGDTARDGKFPYFVDSVGEESEEKARDSVRTKAAWR